MDAELENMRADVNKRASRKRRMKAAFKILLIAEAAALLLSGCLFVLT